MQGDRMTDHDPNRCTRCKRPLYSPVSLAAGYGAVCALRVLGLRHRKRQRVSDGQLALDGVGAA